MPAHPSSRPAAVAAIAYGVVAWLAFIAVFIWFIACLTNVGVTTLHAPPRQPVVIAVLINLGLLLVFALQHSVMARPRFKQAWQRIVPQPLERSTYVLASSAALGVVLAFWQPIGGPWWSLSGPAADVVVCIAGAGATLALAATFSIDHFELFGLRQVWCYATGRSMPTGEFRTPFLYRIVRHPLQLGILMLVWAAPVMTWGHVMFAAGMTLYIWIGVTFEERGLMRVFGESYRHYQRRVPMLLPWPRPTTGGTAAGRDKPRTIETAVGRDEGGRTA